MRCDICAGACCEDFSLPVAHVARIPPGPDKLRWLMLHGYQFQSSVLFDCRCTALAEGRCDIYSSRPNVCREFAIGGTECLDTITRRRTPEQCTLIREEA